MLVSIIIPTYNRLGYLKETLQSALSQTHGDIEVILIDDASTEDTEGLAHGFGDDRIRFFHESHTGMPNTNINKGIRRARGEAVMPLGSDDNLLPDAARRLAERLESNPECVMAYADCWFIDADGNRIGLFSESRREQYAEIRKGGDILRQLLFGNCVCGTTSLIRKSVLERIGVFAEDPDYHIAADYDLWVRLARTGPVEYIHEPLGEFRLHSAQISYDWNAVAPTLTLIQRLLREMPGAGEQKILKKHEAELYRMLNRMHMRSGNEKEAIDAWRNYCRKSGRPWLYPTLLPELLKWRRRRKRMGK